jgi:hypothetical protein
MESPDRRQPGRPTTERKAGVKATVSLRLTARDTQRLDDAAKAEGRNRSDETERRIQATFSGDDALTQAMALSYGADNSGLTFFFAELLRRIAPHGGQWLDDARAGAEVASALAHALRRLRAPDDCHCFNDGSLEARVDAWLDDIAYDDDRYSASGGRSPRARYMLAKRERMGAEIADRLVRRRAAVRATLLEAIHPHETVKPDPAIASSWDRVVAQINARVETPEGDEPAE